MTTRGQIAGVLVDFGGVLTTSVAESFQRFGAELGDAGLPLRLLSSDPPSRRLIADHECGRLSAAAFEEGFAERLRHFGADVPARGLQARMQAGLRPDKAMARLLDDVRRLGTPVAIVSNAFGQDCYRGYDLSAMADKVVLSNEVGVRKPSRRIYAIACESLGIAPTNVVLIDDFQHNLDGAARLGIYGILHMSASGTRDKLVRECGLVGLNQSTLRGVAVGGE